MTIPTRRQRLLFLAQVGVGVVAAPLAMFLVLFTFAGNPIGLWSAGVLLVACLVIASVWALVMLEQLKFHRPTEPLADWAEELRTVRDSRRVIVSAFEIERRRIERDLHDGTQQYLVAATIKLGEAGHLMESSDAKSKVNPTVAELVEGAHQDAEMALRSLRTTVSGIHPQMLSDLGLLPAVTDMAERSGLNITVRCPHKLPTMSDEVAAVAWFFCSEAITNIAKYAPTASVTLLLVADQDLHVSIVDDGPGGAHFRDGGGLAGMRERLAAFGGSLSLASPLGGPTTLSGRIPLLLEPEEGKGVKP